MSIFDIFRNHSYESYLYRENLKLEDQNKALKKENNELWGQLNSISRSNYFPYSWCSLTAENKAKDTEIEWLKIQNKNLKNMAYPSRPCDHMRDSENDLLKSDLIKAKNEIGQLKNENRELKEKLNENRMLMTLEQYEKDEIKNITQIRRLEYDIRKMENKILTLSMKNSELEKELKMYKEFFANNQVNVVLKEDE